MKPLPYEDVRDGLRSQERLLSEDDLRALGITMSRYRKKTLEKRGLFPKRHYQNGRVYWLKSEIEQWLEFNKPEIKVFNCQYEMDGGAQRGFAIRADDWMDAERRLEAIKDSGQVTSEAKRVPAPAWEIPKPLWLRRLQEKWMDRFSVVK